MRDALLEKADDSWRVYKYFANVRGTDFSKQALEIREKAGDKREELKAALEDLLAQKTRGSILGVDSRTVPKAKKETPILVGADGKKYGGEETEIPPVIFGADGKAAAEKKEPTPDELVGASENWDDLINAVTQIGEIVGSDGKVYKAEEINSFLNLIKEQEARGMMFTSKSPLLVSLTRTHGLRSKVIELLDKSEAKAAAVLGPDGETSSTTRNEAAVVFKSR